VNDLQNRIEGLEGKLRELREAELLLTKVQGLDEQKAANDLQVAEKREKLEKVKESLKGLIDKKTTMVQKTIGQLTDRMAQYLVSGDPVFRINDDGSVFIGLELPDKSVVHYSGLPGGPKVTFDTALAYALGGTLLVQEAAELDIGNLPVALEKYGKLDTQVIVSTCHAPEKVPAGWEVVRL
jgi:hypothetical protein